METFELQNDNGPDYRLEGEELAQVTSRGNDSTRWSNLFLYRTAKGTLVAHEVGVSQWEGETTRYTVHVAADEQELIGILGYGWLAKKLYDAADIEHAQAID